ncbi:hypothetical protein I8H89_00375 [Candidatus Saccharibacteria bacterium]|nr:hypothetical protein [Candidatus Saccharibacteria bacterium]
MPAVSTVFLWLAAHEDFSEQYARAKQEAADIFVEDILEIADDAKKDKIPIYSIDSDGKKVLDKKGKPVIAGYQESKTSVQRARVMIDSRKWLAVKLKPNKYGDKLDIKSKSEVTHKFKDMDDDELEAAIQARKD